MKTWMLVLSLAAVLGFSGLADAKGVKHGKPIKGTITAVNGTSFTMTTTPSKKDPNASVQTYTIDASSATITGGTLTVGQKVAVTGGSANVTQVNGQTVQTMTATAIKIAGKHSKKKST